MKRTDKQNRALHLYLRRVADEMNAAGYDTKEVITLPLALTGDIVKDGIFRVIMRAMFTDDAGNPLYESTTELSTSEIQQVFEYMNASLAEKFGVSVDWPSQDGMSFEALRNADRD